MLAGLLFYFQYTTLEKFNVLKPAVRYDTFRDFVLTVRYSVPLGWEDAIVAALIALLFLLFVILEVERGRVSLFLDPLFQSERRTRIALGVLSLVLVRFYFARGELSWAGDRWHAPGAGDILDGGAGGDAFFSGALQRVAAGSVGVLPACRGFAYPDPGRMECNPERGTCTRILVRDMEGREHLGTSPEVAVLGHRVWNQRVELDVRVSQDSFAQLSYAFYPYLRVTVDGKEVTPFQTAGRFIALRLDRGDHQIVLTPFLPPLRKGLLTMELILMALVAGVWIRRRRMP